MLPTGPTAGSAASTEPTPAVEPSFAVGVPPVSRTGRNVVANYLGQGWTALMGLAFIPVYIHYLGVEAYGLIGLFAVLQAFLTLLDMGMTPALSREMARFTAGAHTAQSIQDLLRTLEILCFGLATLMAFGMWAASAYLASDWLKSEQLPMTVLAEALSLMGLVVALRFCEGIYRGSLLGLQRQVQYNIANAALATLRHTGAAGVVIWMSPTVQAFFLWQAGISLVTIAVFAQSVYRALPTPTFRPRFSPEALRGIWKFASGMVGITFLAVLLTQTDKILLSRLLPLGAFGYYTLAAAVSGALYMIIGPITQAAYPRMVELSARQDDAALISMYHQSAQFVTVVTAPAVAILGLFSVTVLFAWSGDAELAAHTAPILAPLILGTFLNGLMWIPYQCQLAHGWTGLTLKINIVAVSILAPALLWVVPRYGALGAAWMWVALNAGYVLIGIQLMHRRLITHEKWRWYFADVALPATAAASVIALARMFLPTACLGRMTTFASLVLIGTLALAASTLAADRIRERLYQVVWRSRCWPSF